MTIALIMTAYIAATVFYVRITWRLVLLSRLEQDEAPGREWSFLTLYRAVLDILFLRRLLKLNPVLWIGEWVFHLAFIVIFLEHTRYVFISPPWFSIYFVPLSGFAVYLLLGSLVYILVYRIVFMFYVKEGFVSKYNLFLVVTILLVSVSGFLLRFVYRTDIVKVKEFIHGTLSFMPVSVPDSLLFAAHFLLALIFISVVPTHIFTAPLVGVDSHRRNAGIGALLHEKK